MMASADSTRPSDLRPDERRISGGKLLLVSLVVLIAIGAIGAISVLLVPAPAEKPPMSGSSTTRDFYGQPR